MTQRLYSFAPLDAIVDLAEPYTTERGQLVKPSASKVLGLAYERVTKYREFGIPEAMADKIAVRLGYVPYELWPEMADGPGGAKRQCQAQNCTTMYVPVRKAQRWCSPACRRRGDAAKAEKDADRERKRYQNDPAKRQAKKARQKRYYEECGDYVRLANQRYYEANAERERQAARARYHANPEAGRERNRLYRERKAQEKAERERKAANQRAYRERKKAEAAAAAAQADVTLLEQPAAEMDRAA